MGFEKGLVSTKIEHIGLMVLLRTTPVFKWYLNDLQMNLPNKSYSRDNRLNKNQAHIQILVWHLDVGFLGLE
jgi:hypothetical protein